MTDSANNLEFNNIIDDALWVEKHYVKEKARQGVGPADPDGQPRMTGPEPSKPAVPISFICGVYNEEARIRSVLEHATRWADEIIVVNKSSTDGTKAICEEFGHRVKVIDIPFSPKGHDDMAAMGQFASNDWIFVGTASEIPTYNLIRQAKDVLSRTNGQLDLVYVPRKIYSFGIHSALSPWFVSHYPFLINRRKAIVTNTIHKNFRARDESNTYAIPFSDDCCVYHWTHPTAKQYLLDMAQYFEAEAAGCTDPAAMIKECFQNIANYEERLRRGGDELLGHYCAWPIYWLGTILFLWEKHRGMDVRKFYSESRRDLLQKEWSAVEGTAYGRRIIAREQAPPGTGLLWDGDRLVHTEDDLLLELNGRRICDEVRTLYIVGAHAFQERVLIDTLFPQLERIYLFEPIPEFFNHLRQVTRNDQRITVFPYAISDSDGEAEFYLTNNDAASSSLLPLGKHKEMFPHVAVVKTVKVETKKLSSVISKHKLPLPDMVFLDVQGAEYRIISSMSAELLSQVRIIYTEVSTEEVYKGAKTLDTIRTLLSNQFAFLGFAPITNNIKNHGNALFINIKDAHLIIKQEKPSAVVNIFPPVKQKSNLSDEFVDESLLTHRRAVDVGKISAAYRKAEAFIGKGKNDDAILELENLLKTLPDYEVAYNDLGVLYFQSGDNKKALQHLETAVRIQPGNATFLKNLADLYHVGMGRAGDALEIYTRILKDYPEDTETLIALGNMSVTMNVPREAKAFFERAVAVDPNNVHARQGLELLGGGASEQEEGIEINNNRRDATHPMAISANPLPFKDGGQKEREQACINSPNELEVMAQRMDTQPGVALVFADGNSESDKLNQKISRTSEENHPLHQKALNHARAGNIREAIDSLERLLDECPHFSLAHNDLGVLLHRNGDKGRALAHFEQASRGQPGDINFLKNLAECYTEMGRTENALKGYVQILNIAPSDLETMLMLGNICASERRFSDAKVFFKRALEIEPSNSEAQQALEVLSQEEKESHGQETPEESYRKAERLLQAGSPEEAIRELERILQAHSDFSPAHNDLGALYYNRGEKDRARYHFEEAVKLDPGNITFLKNLADLYHAEMGRAGDAIEIYTGILKDHPDDVETLIALGNMSMTLNDPREAKVFFEQAMAVDPDNVHARQALEILKGVSPESVEDACKNKVYPKGKIAHERLEGLKERDQACMTTSDGHPLPRVAPFNNPYIDNHLPTACAESRVERPHLVSAIVSTYNAERFIEGCLQDLINQTLFKKGMLEIVIVNSGSQQNEDAVIAGFRDKYPEHIVYLKTEERESIYRAWNRGIKAASGKYITNANTDDRHRRDALEVMAGRLDAYPGVALVYADVFVTHFENQTFDAHIRTGYHVRPEYRKEIMLSGCHMGPQPMWRKSLHDEIGYFDEQLRSASDYEFWCRIAVTHPLLHIPEFLGLYYENPGGFCNADIQLSCDEARLIQRRYVDNPPPTGQLHE
ncbi:MAG: FkbM family methyltransferase [Deltaproteobacteria bacterium]